jgi:glycosyl-4,4'-diaponeurosporenoate acyltransferase
VLPLIELSRPVTVAVDVVAWGVVHAGTGYLAHRLPLRAVDHDTRWTRLRRWERRGRRYERVRIRRWKDRLPEAGAFFAGGVSKRELPGVATERLRRFAAETRRAEYGHVACAAAGPLFALWNPPAVAAVMVAYGIAVNAPFVAIQRYNRARLTVVLERPVEEGIGQLGSGRVGVVPSAAQRQQHPEGLVAVDVVIAVGAPQVLHVAALRQTAMDARTPVDVQLVDHEVRRAVRRDAGGDRPQGAQAGHPVREGERGHAHARERERVQVVALEPASGRRVVARVPAHARAVHHPTGAPRS